MADDAALRDRRAKWRKRSEGRPLANVNAPIVHEPAAKRIDGGIARQGRVKHVAKVFMPPEHARRVVREGLAARRGEREKRKFLNALKYVPHAILKLLENMPMPWDASRTIPVLFHVSGALTLPTETPQVVEPVFLAQWATVWRAMRSEKRDRRHFRRMRFPPFDDDEPPLDYGAVLANAPLPTAIAPTDLALPGTDDLAMWLYDARPLLGTPALRGERYSNKRWRLSLPMLAALHRAARDMLPAGTTENGRFLFDLDALLAAKALNVAVPGGPRFEPPPHLRDASTEDDWTEFNDVHKTIVRVPVRTEHRLSRPFVYSACTTGVPLQTHVGCAHFGTPEGAVDGLPPFFFGEALFPISFRGLLSVSDESTLTPETKTVDLSASGLPLSFGENVMPQHDDEPLQCPSPLFSEMPLYTPRTAGGIALYSAPRPFASRSGRMRRAIDVSTVGRWVRSGRCDSSAPVKTRVSHARLLKGWVSRELHHRPPTTKAKRSLFRALAATRYFQAAQMDWLDAGLQLVRQGHALLSLLLTRRGLSFLHLDHNFNLKPTRTLTTKERKRGRFGHAFHLTRELLRLVKLVVDAHAQHRLGNVDAYQLADALQYVFAHVGQLTGVYRYKYRVMRQVRAAKDAKHIVYRRFNAPPLGRGPGCGFWLPAWRTWLFLLRGTVPLLERWLANLLARHFEGRAPRGPAVTVTRQRTESHYDLELRAAFLRDVLDAMPPAVRAAKHRAIVAHMAEAWRCWKADVPWAPPGLPEPVRAAIARYVGARADWWTRHALGVRRRIATARVMDKAGARKNVGRVARLWLKAEAARHAERLRSGPLLVPSEAVALYTGAARYFAVRGIAPIPFPPVGYRHDAKMLSLALEGLREVHGSSARLSGAAREELALIEAAYDNPHEALARVRRVLLTQRTFRPVAVELADDVAVLRPVYAVDATEKIADAFLDQYLWYEASRRSLFPPFVRPSDAEPAPLFVHRVCATMARAPWLWDCTGDDGAAATVVVETEAEDIAERVDLTLLGRLLRLIVDPVIADYVCARCNAVLAYKDMRVRCAGGVLRGLAFSAFVLQFYALCTVDLPILGMGAALRMSAPSLGELSCSDGPVVVYARDFERVFVVLHLSGDARAALEQHYMAHGPADDTPPRSKRCWQRDARMRMHTADVATARAAFFALAARVPGAVAALSFGRSFVGVYSALNPSVCFGLCGFEVRFVPFWRVGGASGTAGAVMAPDMPPTWTFTHAETNAPAAHVQLRVGAAAIAEFEARVRAILNAGAATTFAKVAARWNTALLGLVAYFREAVAGTRELLDALVRAENRVQGRVKLGLNTKMPARFPPVVFYAPRELGGLGMLSMGHVLVPASDVRLGSEIGGATHFRAGMSHAEGAIIPVLCRYVSSWEAEASDSARVWAEYAARRAEAAATGQRLTVEDLADAWERGVPRIATLFQRDRQTLAYDKGWRSRAEMRRHCSARASPFAWTHARHDGRLWSLDAYRADMVQALGGVDAILAHTLFKATGLSAWEGLFWERPGASPEDGMLAGARLTNAQRTGLSQVPNRRFTLWWSPTINRAAVYVGFQVQLDLTGVLMHGKIPTLKVALVQVFRAHLWQKIHEALVMDVCQALDKCAPALGLASVERLQVHPRKSYRMSSSCADIAARPLSGRFQLSRPASLADASADSCTHGTADVHWVDVQLRWGDYDSHDAERYARARYLDCTTDASSSYPSAAGIVVAVDLAYGAAAAYGVWVPGLRTVLGEALPKIVRASPALHVLQERIRKALALHVAAPSAPVVAAANYGELFGDLCAWIVDDSCAYRVSVVRSAGGGSPTTRAVNGAGIVVVPQTGTLHLSLLPASVFSGQKRLAHVARWKTAEAACAVLRDHVSAGGDSPRALVAARRPLVDPLEVHMLDFPNVSVRGCALSLPLAGLLKHPAVASVIAGATAARTATLAVYDDWLERVSPFTAFSRLLLILRALLVDEGEARRIVPLRNVAGSLWPRLSDDEWAAAEIRLRNVVVGAFCRREGVPPAALTQSEVRDIILGADVAKVSEERVRAAIERSAADAVAAAPALRETVDVHGERILTATTTQYETGAFTGRTDWRSRMMAPLVHGSGSVSVLVARCADRTGVPPIIVPRALLLRLCTLTDASCQVAAGLYGVSRTDRAEVSAMVLPPQTGNVRGVTMHSQPLCDASSGIGSMAAPMGWVHTQAHDGRTLPLGAALATLAYARAASLRGAYCVAVRASPGTMAISPFFVDAQALDELARVYASRSDDPEAAATWAASQAQRPLSAPMMLTDRAAGVFVVPSDGVWSHAFVSMRRVSAVAYTVGDPRTIFDHVHRPAHFLAAVSRTDRNALRSVEMTSVSVIADSEL